MNKTLINVFSTILFKKKKHILLNIVKIVYKSKAHHTKNVNNHF